MHDKCYVMIVDGMIRWYDDMNLNVCTCPAVLSLSLSSLHCDRNTSASLPAGLTYMYILLIPYYGPLSFRHSPHQTPHCWSQRWCVWCIQEAALTSHRRKTIIKENTKINAIAQIQMSPLLVVGNEKSNHQWIYLALFPGSLLCGWKFGVTKAV